MSADARVWCESGAMDWKGWADGTDARPTGELTEVISELEWALDATLYWLPTQHNDGFALSGWTYPKDRD